MVLAVATGIVIGLLVRDGNGEEKIIAVPPGMNGALNGALNGNGGAGPAGKGLSTDPAVNGGGQTIINVFGLRMEARESVLAEPSLRPREALVTVFPRTMFDARMADLLTIVVDSTLDQDVTLQAVGHTSNSPTNANGLVTLGDSVTLSAGNTGMQRVSLVIDLPNLWHPWIGVTITTPSTAPTVGEIQINAHARVFVSPNPNEVI